MLRETLIFSEEFWNVHLVGEGGISRVEARGPVKQSFVHRTALPITKYDLGQDANSVQVERSCLGVPSEKSGIGAHVVAS